jgi:hypothetical protein
METGWVDRLFGVDGCIGGGWVDVLVGLIDACMHACIDW